MKKDLYDAVIFDLLTGFNVADITTSSRVVIASCKLMFSVT